MLTFTYVRDETGIKCNLIGSFPAFACKLYRALSFPAGVKAQGALRKDSLNRTTAEVKRFVLIEY